MTWTPLTWHNRHLLLLPGARLKSGSLVFRITHIDDSGNVYVTGQSGTSIWSLKSCIDLRDQISLPLCPKETTPT